MGFEFSAFRMNELFDKYPELYRARVLIADVLESQRPSIGSNDDQQHLSTQIALKLFWAGALTDISKEEK